MYLTKLIFIFLLCEVISCNDGAVLNLFDNVSLKSKKKSNSWKYFIHLHTVSFHEEQLDSMT